MNGKIKGFDGIRGAAVLSVVLQHLGFFDGLREMGILSEGVDVMINGITGVTAFFVLSGFLITMLLIRELKASGRISLRDFYIRRMLRIFPLYILFLLLVTLIHNIGDAGTNANSLAFASLYLYNFIPNIWASAVLEHTWSLAVEEHFYLIWPLILSLFFNKKRKLLVGLLVFIGFSVFLSNVWFDIDWLNNFNIRRWSFIAGGFIAFGCVAALILFGDEKAESWRGLLGRKSVLFFGAVLFSNSLFLSTYGDLGLYIRAAGIMIIISWIYLNQNSLLVRLLEIRALRYIGVISYGVYMYQGFFLSTGPFRTPSQTWPPDPLTGLILLIMAAPFSYQFFEKPILQLKAKFGSRNAQNA